MKYLLALIRGILAIIVTMMAVFPLTFVTLLAGRKPSIAYAHAQWWAKTLCWVLGLKVEVKGNVPAEQVLVLANHRSYSDIIAMMQFLPCSYVGKKEVRSWPLIGYAAYAGCSIFVDRSSKESRAETRVAIKEYLAMGANVTIYPEGTTFTGPMTKEMKPGAFHIAADGDIPILPVAVEYEIPQDSWVGKETFVPHFVRVFGRWNTRVKIRYGEVLRNEDGLELMKQTRTWIEANLVEMQAEWQKESKVERVYQDFG